MNKLTLSGLVLVMTIPVITYGQADIKVKRSDFRGEKAGFRQAWEHVIAGDAAYDRKGAFYDNAFDHYIQALAYNSKNAELNYKTGISALYTDRKEQAAGFLLKALEADSILTNDLLLYTGRSLQYTGRFNEAVDLLDEYINTEGAGDAENLLLARKFMAECTSAMTLVKDTLPVEIMNMGPEINSRSNDFAPVFTSDGKTIYFASRRKKDKDAPVAAGEIPDENIYISRYAGDSWSIASLAGENLNSEYNESPLYIDSSETRLFIYSGFENGGDIKMAETRRGDWKSPVDIPYAINTAESESSLAISPDGNEIWFVSESKRDNLGGSDIFFIRKTGEKKWSKPQNAGAGINTIYDEHSVSFSESGDTLWFSSRGHNTIGGFDIFYSTRNIDGSWSKAVNAGFPVNTVWDELFRKPTYMPDGSFCFVSNRAGGFGGLDIYRGKMLPGSR